MSDQPHILYIANMRLPSEKAHSVHVMEMCAALAAIGARVTLFVPDRKTHIADDPFHYYGVPRTFEIRRLRTFDAFRLPLPRCIAYYLHSWSFARAVMSATREYPDTTILSRDLYSAYRLIRAGRSAAFEVHDLPRERVAKMLRAIPKIIVTNQWKRDELVRRFGIEESRAVIAPNAVALARFSGIEDSLHRELGWPKEKKIVLYTGHLLSWKGVETLARASALLGGEIGVVMVGGTDEDSKRFRDFLQREHLPVTLLAHRPHADIPALLASASVLVLPTSARESIGRHETSPIKAFEYLAARKPIVASDVPSTREVLNHGDAFFFTPDDPADCARAISDAVANPRVSSREPWTWNARAKSILDFLVSKRRDMSLRDGVACAICSVDEAEIISTKGDLTADITNVVCRRCGLVYINPRPTPAEYEEFHVESFLKERHGISDPKDIAHKIDGKDLKLKSAVIEFVRPILKPGIRVLDVGCGFGTLLHLIKKEFPDAKIEGIELATVDVDAAKRFYNLDLFTGSLAKYVETHQDVKFDLIILHHTFEHFPEPRAELARMKRLLAPGGVMYIGVPDITDIRKRPEIFFNSGIRTRTRQHRSERSSPPRDFPLSHSIRTPRFPEEWNSSPNPRPRQDRKFPRPP